MGKGSFVELETNICITAKKVVNGLFGRSGESLDRRTAFGV